MMPVIRSVGLRTANSVFKKQVKWGERFYLFIVMVLFQALIMQNLRPELMPRAPFRYHSKEEGAAGNISAPKMGHKQNTEM